MSEMNNIKKVKTPFSWNYFPLVPLALFGILAYSNTFTVPFVFDDDGYVVSNPLLRTFHYFAHPSDIAQLDNLSPTAFNATLRYAFMTRILGYLSFYLNYQLNGLNVVGFHLVNLLLHLANGSLVFLIVSSILRADHSPATEESEAFWSRAIAVIVPLLFLLHPIQTHAVTYITSRFVLLASFFFLLSLFLYLQSISSVSRKKYLLYSGAMISAVAAMLSKEFTFTLPFMIVLCDVTFFPGNLRERLRRITPIALTIFVIPTLVFLQQKSLSSLDSTMRTITAAHSSAISRADYLLTQFRVITTYLRLLFFPINQNLDHDFPLYHTLSTPPVFLSLLLLLTLLGVALYLMYRSVFNDRPPVTGRLSQVTRRQFFVSEYRLIPFGILWFFVTMSVESSIIPLGALAAEYRLYLPSVGIIVAFVAASSIAVRKLFRAQTGRRVFTVFFGAALIALGAATHARNNVWKDEISLWEDAARKSPGKLRPHQNLGTLYSMKGRLNDAQKELAIALALDPDNFEIHNNLGIVYRKLGDNERAIREYTAALKLMPTDAMAHYNLGNIFLAQGNYLAAIREYSECLRLIPDYDELHNNLAIAYEKAGRFEDAYREFEQALRLNPQNAKVKGNLENLVRRRESLKP